MLKKIICVLLCMSVMTVCCYADSEAAVPDVSDEYTLLCQLGFLPSQYAEAYRSEAAVTRGDFAAIMAAVLGLERFGLNSDAAAVYADVNADNQNYEAIGYCTDFGLLAGDGTGMFRPSRKITLGQAVKIVMTALGYDKLAELYGGFPIGYMKYAASADVLDGIALSSDDILTADDAYVLICNMLDASMLLQTDFGGEEVSYDTSAGETVLSQYHGIYKYEGQVRATPGASLADIECLEAGEVLIDNIIYQTDIDCTDLIGMEVWYWCDGKSVEGIIPKDDVSYITVNSDEIESFQNLRLTYERNGKTLSADVARAAETVYNGRPAADMTDSDYEIDIGTIKLIDNGGGKDYDTVIVEEPDVYVIKKADTYNGVFYDMYDSSKRFSEEETEIISFKDEFGNDMVIGELNKYDVVSAFVSRDKKYAVLYYSNSEVEGTIDGIDTDARITVGSETYSASVNYNKASADLKLGAKGIFVLDCYGRIAAVKPFESAMQWGYAAAVKKGSGLDPAVTVRLLNSSGDMMTVDVSEKVKLDGENKTADDVYAALAAKPDGQLVRYCLADSHLAYLDTVSGNKSEDSMNMLYSGYNDDKTESVKLRYNGYQRIFGSKVAITTKTKLFVIPPKASSDDEVYRVSSISSFSHDQTYCVEAYRVGNDAHAAEVIVRYANVFATDKVGETVEVTLVDHVSRSVNDEGEERYVIHGLSEGKEIEYPVRTDEVLSSLVSNKTGKPHTLACGDIIKMAINYDTEEVIAVELYYERELDHIKTNTPVGTNLTSGTRMLKANVYSEDDGNLWLTQNELKESGIVLGIDDIESILATTYKIYRCGLDYRGKREVTIGSVDEICDYKTNPNGFSKVVLCGRYNNPGVLVIYED